MKLIYSPSNHLNIALLLLFFHPIVSNLYYSWRQLLHLQVFSAGALLLKEIRFRSKSKSLSFPNGLSPKQRRIFHFPKLKRKSELPMPLAPIVRNNRVPVVHFHWTATGGAPMSLFWNVSYSQSYIYQVGTDVAPRHTKNLPSASNGSNSSYTRPSSSFVPCPSSASLSAAILSDNSSTPPVCHRTSCSETDS